MNRKKIYNPDSNESVNDRKIFGGNPTSIFELNKIKYQWAYQLWKVMLANTWFPEEVNMNQDKKDYNHKLTPEEKTGYDRALAQLIFMDSLQANNLIDNVNPFITSPEINLILVRQAFEECLIEGTEILTSEGFKDFRNLKLTDLVANYNKDGTITYSNPNNIIMKKIKNENLIKIQNNEYNYCQIVTKNHRIVTTEENFSNVKKIETAEEFKNSNELSISTFPVSGLLKRNDKLDDNVKELDYKAHFNTVLAYLYFSIRPVVVNDSKPNYYDSYTEKPVYKYDMFDLFENVFLEYQRYGASYKAAYTFFDTHDDSIKDSEAIRYTPAWNYTLRISIPLSGIEASIRFTNSLKYIIKHGTYEHIKIILDILKNHSEYKNDKYDGGIIIKNEEMLNVIQHFFTVTGGRTYVHRFKNPITLKDDIIVYYNLFNSKIPCNNTEFKEVHIDNGYVYCCSVDSGMIICRYKDNVFVTGNCLHSQSYAVMVESISSNTDDIYELWRKDMMLKSKNDYIANVYEQLADDPTDKTIVKAFYANQILEGIYFYSGFSYFYTLARAGKMLGSSQMIRFIQRDEITHLNLFQNLINSVKKERPELFTSNLIEEVVEMFKRAVEIEISWGEYITQGSILGLTDDIISRYIKYLADQRMKKVGLPTLYNVEHPIQWVEQFSNLNNHKTNFFEAKVTNYAKGSLNLDDF